jgi:hypothetical protein
MGKRGSGKWGEREIMGGEGPPRCRMLATVDDNEMGNMGILTLLAEKPPFHFHKIRSKMWVIHASQRNTSLSMSPDAARWRTG